uniref:Uncharacterized protein n=1 Tax=Rhizophora mucronata TaxID=61149 RepID=A0A2P2NS51_RHIMU
MLFSSLLLQYVHLCRCAFVEYSETVVGSSKN